MVTPLRLDRLPSPLLYFGQILATEARSGGFSLRAEYGALKKRPLKSLKRGKLPFKICRRREKLPFSFHAEVAGLKQDRLLCAPPKKSS